MMKKNDFIRQHPVAIVDGFKQYIVLLLLPLLRSLTLFFDDFYTWLSGVWMDALTLAAIIFFGYLQWYFVRILPDERRLEHRSGLLVRRCQFIPFSNISSLTVEHTWYLKPFRAVRMRVETDAGYNTASDLKVILWKKDAEMLEQKLSAVIRPSGKGVEEPIVRRYEPRGWYIAILSFITSDSLTGAIFAATFISQSGKILGEEAEDRLITSLTHIMRLAASWLPPVAAVIAGIFLGGWLIDFIVTLIRHLGFQAIRRGGELDIHCGIVTRREYTLSIDKVNFLRLRQSLLTKLFGYYAGMVGCTGYGKEKNEQSVLLPAVGREDLRRSLSLILPELRPAENRWKPPLRTLWRIVWPPLLACAAVLFIWRTAYRWLPSLRELVIFLGIMLLIPSVWWLLVRVLSFFHTGIGLRENIFTFRAVSGYRVLTVVCRADKIDKLTVTQNIFQKRNHCADLYIWLRSEKHTCLLVGNLSLDDVFAFLEQYRAACRTQPGS